MENEKIYIGSVELENPLILAPMDGVTDLPFRVICRRLGADFVYNEFVQAEAAAKSNHTFRRKLDFRQEERPIALQIYSGDLDKMVKACQKIEKDYAGDIIDLNFGCWKPGICLRGAGAGMLKNPELMVEIVKACSEAVDTPITVKTRLGWDADSIIIEDLAPRLQEAGCKALALHCRTRQQALSGSADWSYVDKVKAKIDIPLFLNGDIFTPEDAKRAFVETKADGIMIGRAAIADPFIFKYIKDIFKTGVYTEVSMEEKINTCLEHLKITYNYRGTDGLKVFRKHYKGYLKNIPDENVIRKKIVLIEDYNEVVDMLSSIIG